MKPRLFIASSVEGLEAAYAAQENLEYDFDVTVWPQGVFHLSKSALNSLTAVADSVDAAAFVFSADDVAVIGGNAQPAVRDNVLFELGLFIGKLGSDKCFVLKPRSFSDLHLPSDLFGVTPAPFDAERSDGNLTAALGPACNKIRRAFKPNVQARPQNGAGMPNSLEAALVSRPYRLFFNPPSSSKRIRFEPNGRIVEGNNVNEHSWRVVKRMLELVQLDGSVHR